MSAVQISTDELFELLSPEASGYIGVVERRVLSALVADLQGQIVNQRATMDSLWDQIEILITNKPSSKAFQNKKNEMLKLLAKRQRQ